MGASAACTSIARADQRVARWLDVEVHARTHRVCRKAESRVIDLLTVNVHVHHVPSHSQDHGDPHGSDTVLLRRNVEWIVHEHPRALLVDQVEAKYSTVHCRAHVRAAGLLAANIYVDVRVLRIIDLDVSAIRVLDVRVQVLKRLRRRFAVIFCDPHRDGKVAVVFVTEVLDCQVVT